MFPSDFGGPESGLEDRSSKVRQRGVRCVAPNRLSVRSPSFGGHAPLRQIHPAGPAGPTRLQEAPQRGDSAPRPPVQAPPPDLAVMAGQLGGRFRGARVVLLVAIGIHAIALLGFGRGSLPVLMFMAVLWWGLGRVVQMLPGLLSLPRNAENQGVESWRQRLRARAPQGKAESKK